MKLTALSRNATVRVHKTGCADIKRDARNGYDDISDPNADWTSKTEFGLDYWADINAEHEGLGELDGNDIRYVFEDITFLACTNGLPTE